MILTQAEFAQELQVTRAHITQLLNRGMPCRPDRKIDLLKACLWIVNNVDSGGPVLGNAREWLFLLQRRTGRR